MSTDHASVAKDPDWVISLWYVEGWWLGTINDLSKLIQRLPRSHLG